MQRDQLFLAEMIDAAEPARAIVNEAAIEDLAKDRRLRDALAWNFTVLGEAAAQVSRQTKARFPAVAWRQPSRLRNRVVHAYSSIDLDVRHPTASTQLPDFIEDLRSVLVTLEADPL